MRKSLFIFFMAFLCVINCVAQQNLFSLQNGNVVANNEYIIYDEPQLSQGMMTLIENTSRTLHTFSVSSTNNEYECDVRIVSNQEEDESHCYSQFEIRTKSGSLIYKRRGKGLPLTTTRWLSRESPDNHYFRKIDLDNDSYALVFAGWLLGWAELLGEMIIIVVNKNVATLVYDGPAMAITSTNFNSNSFSMDFVTDGVGLTDPETGLLDITPAKLLGRMKYRIYKEGNVLKIASWTIGDGPAVP